MTHPDITTPQKRAGRIAAALVTNDSGRDGFVTRDTDALVLTLEGVSGSRYDGWTRRSDARTPYLPRGRVIRNQRQLSIVSTEDLAEIARRLDLASIDPRWLGANLVIDGIQRLSWLPRGTKLFIAGGAILIVEDQNAPCRLAGGMLARHVGGGEALALAFAREARGLRGLVATVEHPGDACAGSTVEARIPEQWIYR